jgi:hypothetical protein
MTATPGDGDFCILATANEQYTFRAAGGADWTVVRAEGAPFVLRGAVDLPTGAVLQVQLSPEEAARQQEQARLAREAEEERQRAKAIRLELATQRLLAWMSEDQRKTYEEYRWFSVTASDGSPWRIIADGSQSGNVLELDENGEAVRSYCAHPGSLVPAETYLAQSLVIMTDVARFKAVANVCHDYRPQSLDVTFDTSGMPVFAGGGSAGGGGGTSGWTSLAQTLRG